MRDVANATASSTPKLRQARPFAAVLLLALGAGCSDERTALRVDERTFDARDANELFEWSDVPVFEFDLPAGRWEELQANALAEEYEEARVRFD